MLQATPHGRASNRGACPPRGRIGRDAPGLGRLSRRTARRLKLPGKPRVVIMFHLPAADRTSPSSGHPGCEIWYGRWDRYERA